jgi:hypothetical protein
MKFFYDQQHLARLNFNRSENVREYLEDCEPLSSLFIKAIFTQGSTSLIFFSTAFV